MTSVDQQGFIDWDAAPAKEVFPGVTLTIVSGEKIMFSRVDFGPEGMVPEHSHPHEQAGLVLDGKYRLLDELVYALACGNHGVHVLFRLHDEVN